jgi:MFS transporter, DHA2 family, multidrug resistance protein
MTVVPVDNDAVSIRTWVGFIAMCVGMFAAVLDIQIVASSLPEIGFALRIPTDQLSWVQTAYLIAEIIAIPLTGWLTRLLSLRVMFAVAAGGFTLASVGCAISNGFAPLIAFRVLQGFCGGAIIPAVFTSVFVLFPLRAHVRATAIGGFFAVLAPTLGPVVGGYITETFSWHWLFLINLVPGLVVSMLVPMLLRTTRGDRTLLRHVDILSLVLVALCLTSLEVVLKEAPTRGWGDGLVLTLIVLCAVTGTGWIAHSRRRRDPLVRLDIFRDFSFAVGCAYSFLFGAGLYGSVYLLPLFLGYVRHHSPLEIGTIMLVSGAAQLLAAPIAAPLEARYDRRWLAAFGYGIFGAGLLANGFATAQTDFDGLLWPQILRGIGVMFCILPMTTLALEGRPADAVADASGLFNMMRNLGGAIGIAMIDTILETRPAVHVQQLVARLQAGDPDAARLVGLSVERFHNVPIGPVDAATQEFVRPLVERAAAAASFNDAYRLLGILFIVAVALLPLLVRAGRDEGAVD